MGLTYADILCRYKYFNSTANNLYYKPSEFTDRAVNVLFYISEHIIIHKLVKIRSATITAFDRQNVKCKF